ncbi:putative DCC family thiol-disulfide oxidoreductase YuxK [Gracilibacillus halotolerans]|uniref:Putative DCC family thiol-disulfide oxidoreductase YuxK n=1 Tax=Gracilibacillus halotolerans TaxID=74386 RepID=A0A841RIT0_9BACI|nr:thiol-disulfide oxidoreductase DCC family protein [Gracilibacillus halotolerans]MBB6512581.1 putative DCC family thiol-disulfide oxidoreductase YuxK [Gracilibacillus halotolerans]
MQKIILFDGVCNFCNQSVQFIIKRDPKQQFQFASLQSDIGEKLIKEYKIPEQLDSLIIIENKKYFTMSTAALKIARHLQGPIRFLYVLIVIPKPIRDFVYKIVAKNRYKWFGKRESCMIPSPEDKKRFLD